MMLYTLSLSRVILLTLLLLQAAGCAVNPASGRPELTLVSEELEIKLAETEKQLSLKILVVDDDALGRQLMQLILTKEGHHVEVAINGLEALHAVKQNQFDIVFMDLHMPEMDGMEASRQIRAWEKDGSHTFIVALTASYLPEIGEALFDAGMDNYISKPLDVAQVQRLLKYSSPATH